MTALRLPHLSSLDRSLLNLSITDPPGGELVGGEGSKDGHQQCKGSCWSAAKQHLYGVLGWSLGIQLTNNMVKDVSAWLFDFDYGVNDVTTMFDLAAGGAARRRAAARFFVPIALGLGGAFLWDYDNCVRTKCGGY